MSQSVLVFGSEGFVGRYLAKEFRDHGYEVFGSDRNAIWSNDCLEAYSAGDVMEAQRVREICYDYEPNVIVNLAAVSSVGQSWNMPQATLQVNAVGTLNIFEAAKNMSEKPKILLIGSSEEYAPSDKPLKETDPIDATNPYGISKTTQGQLAGMYADRYALEIFRTRSFNHTGIGQSSTFVLPSWCEQAAKIKKAGVSGTITVGNLDVSRDFGDVRDIVRAYRLIVESGISGEVFNVGTGRALSLRQLLADLISYADAEIDVRVDDRLLRPNDNTMICCDRSKLTRCTGWTPTIEIQDTLRDMFDHCLASA